MLENLYSNKAHGKRSLTVTEILTIFFTDLKIKDFKSCSEKERNNHGEWKRRNGLNTDKIWLNILTSR